MIGPKTIMAQRASIRRSAFQERQTEASEEEHTLTNICVDSAAYNDVYASRIERWELEHAV